jgi:C4-dicarboxylate transporter DctM subunit
MELALYFLALIFLMFFGVPIAYSLLISAVFYIFFLSSIDPIILPQKLQVGLNSFPLLAVPFFLMLGNVMGHAGITVRLVGLANALVGHIRGGLAHVTIVTCMFMGGVQGAATSEAAAVGSILIPAMTRTGYSPSFAAALTAAASILGPIIPPSLPMVIFGSLCNVSIGRLFLGGAVPGILLGFYLMLYSYIMARQGKIGQMEKLEQFSFLRLQKSLKGGSLPFLIPVVIVGGIVGGVFTPTESGAVATMIAIALGILVYRQFRWKQFIESSISTLYILGSVMIIVAGAAAFGYILNLEGAAKLLGAALFAISKDPLMIMVIINILLLILGCFLETLAIIILVGPILLPIAVAAGFDPVHIGVVMVLNLAIGMTTPPVGLCIFVSCGIAGISVREFMRDMFPLYVPLLLGLITIVLFPQTVMFLPNLLMPVR